MEASGSGIPRDLPVLCMCEKKKNPSRASFSDMRALTFSPTLGSTQKVFAGNETRRAS